ncbi:hypothetical protein PJI17_06100 [Mycobacterium kansasii]|uniref:Uncharacterized protein n=2 Tax=Mycobacterium kansasii TaxID=1768 RepID=A0A1V3X6W1_MYCKA|nr:hypothetical protein MKAN_09635 [Mycobacterium kansasii ATCC 12478]ETZ98935.1 hypothetical protein I547_5913 [Mycobacterium kansasii 824]KEP39462.1 hypothetical protein MKSMC1_53970 [Mycobacterium kansasii]OOK70666.1 hypothetical protein BZL30_6117 [Mycobacterium kansasii]OOK74546.1 hypothetical protein BZL29_4172 [Mycobacterium kansasii]
MSDRSGPTAIVDDLPVMLVVPRCESVGEHGGADAPDEVRRSRKAPGCPR